MKLYYKIWADAINYERIKNGGEDHWKVFTFAYMSFLLSLNIAAFLSSFLFVTGFSLASKIREFLMFFSSELLTNFLWAVITLFIPSICINYFLVFYKKKYEYILEYYEFNNGKYLLIYFCITVVAFFGFSLLNKLGNLPELLS